MYKVDTMIKRRFIGLALLAGSVLPLLAQDVTIDSPDEKLKLTVSCPAGGGSVSYSIVYDGRQMFGIFSVRDGDEYREFLGWDEMVGTRCPENRYGL